MVRYKILPPSLIRFTANQIPRQFENGVDLETIVENIVNKTLDPEHIAAIHVFNIKGIYHTCDNKRLYVFRAAQYAGVLDFISVVVVSPCEYDLTVIRPGCEGKIVNFNDCSEIHPHWNELWAVSPKRETTNISSPPDGAKYIATSEYTVRDYNKCPGRRTASRETPCDEGGEESNGCCSTIFCCFDYSRLEENEVDS